MTGTTVSEHVWTTIGEPLNAMVTMDQSWMIRQAETNNWNIYRRNAALVWERVAVRSTLLESVRFASEGHRPDDSTNADGACGWNQPTG